MKPSAFRNKITITWLLRIMLAFILATALPLVVSCTGGGDPGSILDPGLSEGEEPDGVPSNIIQAGTDPDPAVIGITGTGNVESIILTFYIVDINNEAVVGEHLVNFEILHGGLNGGEKLNNLSSVSSIVEVIDGSETINYAEVKTVFNSGTRAGTVQIRASLDADPTMLSDVSVTITGGLPAGNSFGLSFSPLCNFGLWTSGLEQSVRTDISDYFSNPVAPNIQINYQTDYSSITGTGTFLNTGEDGSGNASVFTGTLTSGTPKPIDGYVTVAAQTIGGNHSKVLSLAVDPADEDTIYAGTDGGGIFKTIDGGTSWELIGYPLKDTGAAKFANLTGTIVRDLLIDPNNSQVIYAATNKGVFVSTNAGGNWKTLTGRIRIVGDNVGITDGAGYVEIDGNNPAEMYQDGISYQYFSLNYSSTGTRSRMNVRVGDELTEKFVESGNGFYLLDDFGALPAGMNVEADYDASSGVPNPIYAVAVNPDLANFDLALGHAKVIYAGTYGDGVWKTENGGKSWERASTMAFVEEGGVTFGRNILTLAVNTANPAEIFAGTEREGLFKSSDSADTWTKVTGSLDDPINETEVRDILVEPRAQVANNLWIAGKNGIHFTTDGGSTWQEPTVSVTASDPTNADVRAIERDPNNGTLYAATFGDVLNKSEPHGGVYKSSDDGKSWSIVTDLASSSGAHALDSLAVCGKEGDDILIAGTEGRTVLKSNDSGVTWSAINGESPTNLTNTLFATGEVMHSGWAEIEFEYLNSTYRGYGNWGGEIYNTEAVNFYIRISDYLGNRLIPETSIDISIDTGTGTNYTITLPDGVSPGNELTDFYVRWVNDLDGEDSDGTINVKVSSEVYEKELTFTYLLYGIFAASPSALEIDMPAGTDFATGTISSSGGSGVTRHVFTNENANGSINSGIYTYTEVGLAPGEIAYDTINIVDIGTGQTLSVPVKITKEE